MIKILSLIIAFTSGGFACNDSVSTKDSVDTQTAQEITVTNSAIKSTVGYQLDSPVATFKLDKILEEISGLGISDDGVFLYAVQDEMGAIFKLDKATGEIVEKIKFHKDGDYEGIEVVGDDIYVLKSTGTLYQVINAGKKKQEMHKFKSFLTGANDVEGLAYDRKNNRLLLACKGIPSTTESFESARFKKAIYAFDLTSKTLDPTPVYTIQLATIRNYLEQHKSLEEYEKLVEFFSAGKENLTFNPSAIAVHPFTGDIYITSSSGKVMVVLDEVGQVVFIEKLDKDVHRQPEGLVFDQDGALYISNEGKGGKGRIHRFAYIAD